MVGELVQKSNGSPEGSGGRRGGERRPAASTDERTRAWWPGVVVTGAVVSW